MRLPFARRAAAEPGVGPAQGEPAAGGPAQGGTAQGGTVAGVGDPGSVPTHPELVPGEPDVMRWVIPPATLEVRGPVTAAPGELGELLGSGLISAAVEPDAVVVRLVQGDWSTFGPRVRTALGAALTEPEAWGAVGEQVVGSDAALIEAAHRVIDGDAGDYVRSHGGHIELVAAQAGRVDVRLTGACGHCPAAAATLRHRVETALRAAYPGLVEVRQV